MNPILKNIIIISAIIPASFLFYVSVFWIFVIIKDIFHDWPAFVFTLCFSLGILGYIGLWRNLILSKSKRGFNSLLLGLGIAGCVLFIIYEGGMNALNLMISFEEPFESLIMIWPIIVSIFIIVLNLKPNKN